MEALGISTVLTAGPIHDKVLVFVYIYSEGWRMAFWRQELTLGDDYTCLYSYISTDELISRPTVEPRGSGS